MYIKKYKIMNEYGIHRVYEIALWSSLGWERM